MQWFQDHKKGVVDAIIGAMVLAILAHFSRISADILQAANSFRHFAYDVPGAGWAIGLLWAIAFLVCWLVFTGVIFTYNWLLDPHPLSHLYRNKQYEDALAHLLEMVNQYADRRRRVPLETRYQMVRVLKLFEAGVIDIIGHRYQDAFRMIWLRPDDQDPRGVRFWTPKDRVGPRELNLIMKALSLGQWIITVEPRKLEDEPRPEYMRTLYCIRNMNAWQVGFVIAVDRWIPMTRVKKERLMGHLMMLMPLFETWAMQRVIMSLERVDWKTEVATDDQGVAQ